MPDREPRYRLLDEDGNIVGSLFEPETGGIELKDTVNDTSLTLDEDGLTTPAVNTERSSIGNVVSSVRIDPNTDIPDSTFTQLEFGDDIYEEDNDLSIDTTNNVITVQDTGAYLVTANPVIDAPSEPDDVRHIIEVAVDGSDRSPRAMSRYRASVTSTIYQLPTATWIGRVSDGSNISVELWQGTGETVQTGPNEAKIEVMRLG